MERFTFQLVVVIIDLSNQQRLRLRLRKFIMTTINEKAFLKTILTHYSKAIQETDDSNERRESYQSLYTPAKDMMSYYDVMFESLPKEIELNLIIYSYCLKNMMAI